MFCLEMVFNILIVLQRPHDDFWANPSLSSAFYWPRWTEVTVRSLFGELHKDTICKQRCLCLMSSILHRYTAGQPPPTPAWLFLRSKYKNLTNVGCSQDPWILLLSPIFLWATGRVVKEILIWSHSLFGARGFSYQPNMWGRLCHWNSEEENPALAQTH